MKRWDLTSLPPSSEKQTPRAPGPDAPRVPRRDGQIPRVLFTSPEALARVRACPGEDCGWLFYDATGRRRWCSMASCGTRHKVRRFRARQRDTVTA